MAKTLSEVKAMMKTDKVFETQTAFGVNDFGKYRPNITFILAKEFDADPLAYRRDAPTREMTRDMNIDLDGEVGVLFGDFWKSQKGGACFRPKPIAQAQHVLMQVGWGGAFSRTRGVRSDVAGAVYYRCAVSNGGGAGNDYLVVPVGFYRAVRDVEIDGNVAATAPNFAERAKTIREKFTQYDREQADKASAEARAKAQAEDASKAAKVGLLPRLEAANIRLVALGREPVGLGEISFRWGWQNQHYGERNVAEVERQIAQLEAERAEQEHKRLAREWFQPKFEAFKARAEAINISIEFGDETVRLAGEHYGQPYSDEGLAKFVADLDKREREAAEARAKAQAEATYQTRKTEAAALGLPTDIRIWCRRGGRTNAGDGWVIGPDGQDRGNTAWYNPRPRYSSEGDKIWEQILSGEVVLKWSKSCSAAAHEFEVIHLPSADLTEAQLERIGEIQDELGVEWEGARGLASGLPSPPVGKGWGLLPRITPARVGRVVECADVPLSAALSPAPEGGSVQEAVHPAAQGIGTPASAASLASLAAQFGSPQRQKRRG